jgi:uncharacterized DUF497 family protein
MRAAVVRSTLFFGRTDVLVLASVNRIIWLEPFPFRIISARRAEPTERRRYEKENG